MRRSRLPDPRELPNVGSFFKNPVIPAAQRDDLRREYPELVDYPQPDGSYKLAAAWLEVSPPAMTPRESFAVLTTSARTDPNPRPTSAFVSLGALPARSTAALNRATAGSSSPDAVHTMGTAPVPIASSAAEAA